MAEIEFDYSNAEEFMPPQEFAAFFQKAEAAKAELLGRQGKGNDFLGWIDLPEDYNKEEFARIKKAAEKIRSHSQVLLVIGIGGSYLGARAAIEFLSNAFANALPAEKRNAPEIYFVGNNISGTYLSQLVEVLGDRDFSINVISKSGTTTEPAIAFRIFRAIAEKKYGKEKAAEHIFATTDKAKGALKSLAGREGYETFVVPDDIGGRFSVLTAVGLLPIAVAGIDIDALMQGARDEREELLSAEGEKNQALMYAAVRNLFLNRGKRVEVLANYEPQFHYVAEWWKQLYGESEGKEHKGLFPASIDLTTDLHSMGQYMQDGQRMMLETVVCIDQPLEEVTIEEDPEDLDGLNYLAGKTMDFVNKNAMKATILAHVEGGVPNLLIHVPGQDAHSLGALFYFFEFACGVSGYISGVNPFDQPGVESYKKHMFALLGKPGYEELRKEIEAKEAKG